MNYAAKSKLSTFLDGANGEWAVQWLLLIPNASIRNAKEIVVAFLVLVWDAAE
jgi:hypothetical protein